MKSTMRASVHFDLRSESLRQAGSPESAHSISRKRQERKLLHSEILREDGRTSIPKLYKRTLLREEYYR